MGGQKGCESRVPERGNRQSPYVDFKLGSSTLRETSDVDTNADHTALLYSAYWVLIVNSEV